MGSEHSRAQKTSSYPSLNTSNSQVYHGMAHSYSQYTQNQMQYPTYAQTAGAQPQAQHQQQQHQLSKKQKRLSQYSQLQYSPQIPINGSLSVSSQQLSQLGRTPSQTMSTTIHQYPNGTPLQNTHYFTLPNTLNGFNGTQDNNEETNEMAPRPLSDTNIFHKGSGIFGSIKNLSSQKLFVIRHGERVDTTFGVNWVENCFDSNGRYIRFNLNMPKSLPTRDNPKFDYLFDPPLTEMGLHQAKLTGEELLSQGTTISHCYCSPALRSIQTADKILEGMNLKNTVPIRIELGLFEYLPWQINMPNKYPFMDIRSLVAAGFNIDLNYSPVLMYEMLRFDETIEIYYQRSYYMTKTITDMHSRDGKNIMFVGHAPTIEVCTRQLCGNDTRVNEFRQIVRKVPFLAIAQCEKNPVTQTWKLKKPPIPALKHLAVDEFDWKNLQNTNTLNHQTDTNNPYFQQHQQQHYQSTPKVQHIPVIARSYVPWRV